MMATKRKRENSKLDPLPSLKGGISLREARNTRILRKKLIATGIEIDSDRQPSPFMIKNLLLKNGSKKK